MSLLAITDPPQDFTGFLIWALVIVCITLAGLAGSAIKWSLAKLSEKEVECKSERLEDQRLFLLSLSSRDQHMSALTVAVQETNKLVEQHHLAMTRVHSIESETIARIAGEAAVSKYLHDNPHH